MSLGTVTLWVLVIAFMFVSRTRFPVKKSIVNVLRKRYGKILAKNVRMFEKYDFKYKAAIHDLYFLLTCKEKYNAEVFKVQGGQQTVKVFE